MLYVKTIKDVDEPTWGQFKSIAARQQLTMGQCLKKIVIFYEEQNKDFWREILKGKPILTKKEAEDIREITAKLRQEHGFRR